MAGLLAGTGVLEGLLEHSALATVVA